MKKKNLLTVAGCFLALSNYSQVLTIQSVETKLKTNQGIEFLGKEVEKTKDLFLFPTWRNKGVLYIDGKEFTINNINFNISNNAVSCELKNGKYFVFNSVDVQKFSINGQTFKKNGRAYYEVLVEESKTYFYKRYDVRYQDGVTHRIGGGQVGGGKRVLSYAYLIKSGRDSRTIELNKKSVLELFSNQEDELKNFVKENDLSYKKEKDLITIISYMLKKGNELT